MHRAQVGSTWVAAWHDGNPPNTQQACRIWGRHARSLCSPACALDHRLRVADPVLRRALGLGQPQLVQVLALLQMLRGVRTAAVNLGHVPQMCKGAPQDLESTPRHTKPARELSQAHLQLQRAGHHSGQPQAGQQEVEGRVGMGVAVEKHHLQIGARQSQRGQGAVKKWGAMWGAQNIWNQGQMISEAAQEGTSWKQECPTLAQP